MAWFLHAVEHPDGRWSCRRGRTVFDTHEDRAEAIRHLKTVAIELGVGTLIFAHTLTGSVEPVE